MTAALTAAATRVGRRTAARWMVTFVGFPLGGLTAMLTVGAIDNPWSALGGGLLTGAFIGTAQAIGLARTTIPALPWIAATAGGLVVGLTAGAATVGYATSLTALVIQGAISGLGVGVAQAIVLRQHLGWVASIWPAALAAVWAAGWAVTTLGGIQVEDQFTVFGSFGALTATALTTILPLALARAAVAVSPASTETSGS